MPNTWSREFGTLISAQRKLKKLPFAQSSSSLSYDTTTLSKIQNSEQPANSKTIPVIAELFELDFKELQIRHLPKNMNDE